MKTTLTACLLAVAGLTLPAPAAAGGFTGYAFDACEAPSQATMDAWRASSPFAGVGVYVAGANRRCSAQQHLTATWVATQARRGWRILPITVGRQAACYAPSADVTRIDDTPGPRGDYVTARAQGRAEAASTVSASQALGFAKGTTHWLDIEDFDPFDGDDCRRSMLAFVSGWTSRLHELGYRSGLYSNVAAGITAVEGARKLAPGSYQLPDQLWFAHYDGRVTTDTDVLADSAWRRQRIKQYAGDRVATYGGVTLSIDHNWADVGGGTRAPAQTAHCGVPLDFPTYPTLRRGDSGPRVAALQCRLRQRGAYDGRITSRFDGPTRTAVLRYQRRSATLTDTGVATPSTWTALLSAGTPSFVKVGSGHDAVRRLQRALNAATGARLPVTGIFDRRTERAVKAYQERRRLPRTGVVTRATWTPLQQGRR